MLGFAGMIPSSIKEPVDIFEQYATFWSNSVRASILLLGAAYICGFLVYPLGRSIHKYQLKKGANNDFVVLEGKELSPGFVKLRELAPVNFKYIEKWHMYAALAHGVGTAAVIGLLVSSYKVFVAYDKSSWAILAIICVFIAALSYRRALTFGKWAIYDFKNAIDVLHLDEKAASFAAKE